MLLPLFIVFYPFSTNSQSCLPSQVEHQCQNRMVRGGKKVILHLAYDQAEWSLSPYLSLWLSNFVCNFMKESCSDLCSRACSPTALTNQEYVPNQFFCRSVWILLVQLSLEKKFCLSEGNVVSRKFPAMEFVSGKSNEWPTCRLSVPGMSHIRGNKEAK